MAKNKYLESSRQLELNVSAVNGSGTGDLVKSGDPVAVGKMSGVALTDENASGMAMVARDGVFRLAVRGQDAVPANVAVNVGDELYWDNTPGEVNRDATNGVFLGYALEAVASGATTTIKVALGR